MLREVAVGPQDGVVADINQNQPVESPHSNQDAIEPVESGTALS